MTTIIPATSTIRDQFAAYEDPRLHEATDYNAFGEVFDSWYEAEKAKIRREALLEARDILDGAAKALATKSATDATRAATETFETAATKIHCLAWI